MPRILKPDLIAGEVAADRWLVSSILALDTGEPHEVRCVRRAAAERPTCTDAVAALHGHRRADGSSGADHEGSRIREPFTGDRGREIAADAAHAGTVADK